MYNWQNSPTLIIFPDQKPFRLHRINYAEAVELRTLAGELVSAELVMGRHRINVKNFNRAKALAQAIFEACRRGDEVFDWRKWKWGGK